MLSNTTGGVAASNCQGLGRGNEVGSLNIVLPARVISVIEPSRCLLPRCRVSGEPLSLNDITT